ncbi:MAG: FIST N-terminal domain-containing protein, partial [Myxococcota bacterium]
MEVRSLTYDLLSKQWSEPIPKLDSDQTLVLAFGSPELDLQREGLARLRAALPRATLLGCSGAGEIAGRDVRDDALIVTVTRFAHTRLKSARVSVSDRAESYAAGQTLAKYLAGPDLRAVFVLSEGLQVNGTELVRGMNDHLPAAVVVTGGLAGDGSRFERTWVAHDDLVGSGVIAAVGLYGDHVRVGHGSKGGWDRFGPERTVTRADGNVLYELDGKPALALYKQYLGPKAADLPASGLLFPLAIRSGTTDDKVLVRTVLAVDEATQSMTFAGDVPTGSLAQLMKADFDRLVTGAESAATSARTRQLGAHPAEFGEPEVDGPMLAVAISCVGRRMVLGDRTEEEIEAISDVLPPGANITGFYSYGELSPHANGRCDLHNQTMTITTFAEVEALPAVDDDTVVRSGFEVRTVHYDLKTRAWSQPLPSELDAPRTLVVAFGSPIIGERHPEVLQALRKAFRRSVVVGCSGAGEIVGGEVRDGVVTVAVARFGKTDLAATAVDVPEAARSYDVGRLLATGLARPDLRAVFVLSDGLGVNGTDLVHGLNDNLDPSVVVTGGLAGDGTRFQKTWVLYGDEVRA